MSNFIVPNTFIPGTKAKAQEVNENFKSGFNRQIGKLQAETGKNDLKNILSTLKDAYQNAGLQRDSEVLEKQIRKLDLEV